MIKKYNQYIKETIDIDPYGEEDWEIDNLSPILQLAKEYNSPLDQIQIFSCFNKQLNTLEGIEQLNNLELFNCSNNLLTSLDGIEKLNKLKILYCRDNRFSEEYKEYLKAYCKQKNITLNI